MAVAAPVARMSASTSAPIGPRSVESIFLKWRPARPPLPTVASALGRLLGGEAARLGVDDPDGGVGDGTAGPDGDGNRRAAGEERARVTRAREVVGDDGQRAAACGRHRGWPG